MSVRKLYGMQYSSIELEHDVVAPMSEVLHTLAHHLEDNDEHGLLTAITTNNHPDNDDKFLTTLVWAI